MVQHRDGGSGFFSIFLGLDSTRWQNLEDGNYTDIVECKKDRNKHGDGANLVDLYAQRGGDVAPYTSDNDEEIAWNSWPTSDTVTVYDGNFLNYLENPSLIMDSRINIVNNTAKAILNAIEGINVGVMRFNNNQGGPVIVGMQDLDSNRAAIIDTIDSITAGGATPVSEAMYEAGYHASSRLYEEVGKTLGMTPTQFRNSGAEQSIRFAVVECSLGWVAVAATERGICSIQFGDRADDLRDGLFSRFANAKWCEDDPAFLDWVRQVVEFVDTPELTYAVGDAKYAYDWQWKWSNGDPQEDSPNLAQGWTKVEETPNDFQYQKQPYDYMDKPFFMKSNWIAPGMVQHYVKKPWNPVHKAFRTAALIRGTHPYAVIVDDVRKDDQQHYQKLEAQNATR